LEAQPYLQLSQYAVNVVLWHNTLLEHFNYLKVMGVHQNE